MAELFPFVMVDGRALDRRQTCAWLAQRLRAGEEVSQGQREFLARALEAAAAGRSIDKALGVSRPRGAPKTNADRDDWIYREVESLAAGGQKYVEAYEAVGAECAKWGQFPSGDPVEAVKEIHLRVRKAYRGQGE